MRIKRYFAPDIRQGMRLVREEQGPDAVILSNKRVDGGVEVVAAIDYDESLFNSDVCFVEDAPRYSDNIQKPVEPSLGHRRDVFPKIPMAKHPSSKVEWSQDPAMVEMRGELKSLRGLLENQLSGLAWGDMTRRYPQRIELMQRLIKMGLSTSLCNEITESMSKDGNIESHWYQALEQLALRIPVGDDDILTNGGVVALVGPTGVGKTTTAAKLAARYALRHGNRHVALVTIDDYRVGAYEQLRTYGRILDIPVKTADSREELNKVLGDLCDRRLVLIDTAGMCQRSRQLTVQAGILNSDHVNIKSSLVMSATTRLSGLEDIVRSFEIFKPEDCIFTKLDEATSMGGALSVVVKHKLPISYVSDGQQVPEDLHQARAHNLVRQSTNIYDNSDSILEEEFVALSMGRAVANARF